MLPLMMLGLGKKKKKKSQRGGLRMPSISIPKIGIDKAMQLGNLAKNIIVDKKLISKGLNLIDHPIAQGAAVVADQLGLGKKKRKSKQRGGYKTFGQVGPESTFGNGITPFVGMGKKKKQRGGGIFSDLGGGIGAATYGLGSGLGNLGHGLFGGGKKHHGRHIKM